MSQIKNAIENSQEKYKQYKKQKAIVSHSIKLKTKLIKKELND